MSASRFSDDEASFLLSLYRRLFPRDGKGWPALADYWDFRRTRPWNCLTTDFHGTTLAQVRDLDARRRAWDATGDAARDGAFLAHLAARAGCGFSLGLGPWTDSALHATVTPTTKSLVVLVGHDGASIVPPRGPAEARPPLEILPLLDAQDPAGHALGLPTAEAFRRAGVGLLYLNLVPDFRAPGLAPEKDFPFQTPGFGYAECAAGLLAALESAAALHPVRGVVTWGTRPWEALRGPSQACGGGLGVSQAALRGGRAGFALGEGPHALRVHPFPHPAPGRRHLLWTPALQEAYAVLWTGLLARH
jgi:hypothetical protein